MNEQANLTRLPFNVGLAAGHVFDLGLWAAQCVLHDVR